ncbi:MAG: hypothetical protein J7518_12060 [Nocardioidaceae bacterium]|nr:hypothetical protein [Nocardioidaceae bacterium]
MSASRPSAALRAAATRATLLLTLLLGLVVVSPPTRAAEEPQASPLTVRLARLTPATIPRKGAITLVGSVRNDSEETWSAINVHPFLSRSPITSRDELAAAAATDPDTEVGTRITQVGLFATIGDLAPGQSARFRISLPVAALRLSQPGVYWIGVHALGQNADGRDGLADGRARTFIPLVPAGQPTSAVALVVPLREQVRRDPDGRLEDTADWSATLSSTGRLRRIVDFLESAGAQAYSAMVDPAVLEAAESVAANNPPISFGKEKEQTPSPTPTQTSRSLDRLDEPDRANATAWLGDVKALAAGRGLLGLAYGDPDTAGLARYRPAMLRRAERLSADTFERLELGAVPTVAPPDGWLDDDALSAVAPGSLVLVSDHGAPRTRTQWRTSADQDLVFADAQTSSGGPGPTPRLDALALRQRIVADAALRAGEPGSGPLVVQLPATWDPGPGWEGARFFETLGALPWLSLTGVLHPELGTPTFDAALGYPKAEQRREVGPTNIGVAADLIRTATVLGQLLETENSVEHSLTGDALAAVSYHARDDREAARLDVLSLDGRMQNRLGDVAVTGTDFVRLSGSTGTVAVTLVNRLEQPITVGISASTDSPAVRIDGTKAFTMAPGERAVRRLRVHASSIGVHEVTLTPITGKGAELGTPLTFSLRTSQVGTLIWYVFGAAGLLLVVMIGRRIRRGVRQHRWRGAE